MLGLLLVVELLVFTTRFNVARFADEAGPWAVILNNTFLVGRFAISVAAALLIFGGRRIADLWSDAAAKVTFGRVSWRALAVHSVAVVTFYLVARVILENSLIHSSLLPWLAVWVVAGMIAIVSWAAVLLPWEFWALLAHRARGTLLLGGLFGVAAVAAGSVAENVWPLVAGPTLRCVEAILRICYDDVVVNGQTIACRGFSITINAPCSGFEGIGLIGLFVTAFLWSFREHLRFPQALALLPAGMAAIWAANLLRIAALVVIGASYSPSVATGGFHSQAGWLAFNFVALALVYVAWNSSAFRTVSQNAEGTWARAEYLAAPYLAPLLTLLALMMITTALSAQGFQWLYPIRVAATLGAIAWFYPRYREHGILTWSWSLTPLIIGAAVFALWMVLEPFSGVDSSASKDQAAALASATPLVAGGWILFRAIGSIATVPFAEELAFRGFLTRQLINEDFESVPLGTFSWFSLVASSVLFGLLHGRWLAGSLAGMLFAVALYRRRRLSDAIVAHAFANALVTAYVLATGNWAAWS